MLIRKEQDKFINYQDLESERLVAVNQVDAKRVSSLYKKHKRADKIPDSEIVDGYFFVLDEEFDSLKIDFETKESFRINQLVKPTIK